MAEVNTADAEAKADAAFGAGFGGTPPVEPVKVVEEATPVAVVAPPAAAPAKVPEKPQYAKVLQSDWEKHNAMFGKVASLESTIAKLTGSMPKADALIQQVVDRVRAETPAGLAVEFLKEDFAELAGEYPELAERLEKLLNKAKVKGTATTEAAKPAASGAMDQAAIDKAVETALGNRAQKEAADKRETETKALLEAYPEWGKIVGAPFAMGTAAPVDTDWRKWATTNDPSAITTDSPAEVMASIAKFNESLTAAPATPAKPDKAAARRAVMEDAVTPRTDGAAPPLNQPASAEDAFAEGFKKGRPRS